MAFTSCILFTSVTSEQNTMSKGHLALKKATLSCECNVHRIFFMLWACIKSELQRNLGVGKTMWNKNYPFTDIWSIHSSIHRNFNRCFKYVWKNQNKYERSHTINWITHWQMIDNVFFHVCKCKSTGIAIDIIIIYLLLIDAYINTGIPRLTQFLIVWIFEAAPKDLHNAIL